MRPRQTFPGESCRHPLFCFYNCAAKDRGHPGPGNPTQPGRVRLAERSTQSNSNQELHLNISRKPPGAAHFQLDLHTPSPASQVRHCSQDGIDCSCCQHPILPISSAKKHDHHVSAVVSSKCTVRLHFRSRDRDQYTRPHIGHLGGDIKSRSEEENFTFKEKTPTIGRKSVERCDGGGQLPWLCQA